MTIKLNRLFVAALVASAAVCALATNTFGQSTDQSLPTPVLANEINGRIAALDVGDPRATRHFYAFAANAGDLLVTLDTKNLNGDVDVFTAITFRPLMKTTVYATTQSQQVTKGIYLRAHQILILREGKQAGTGRNVPHLDGPVERAGNQPRAIGEDRKSVV